MPESRSKIGGWPLAAAIAVIVVFLFFVREILLPFVIAAAIAFILTPLVDWIARRFRIRRWIGAVGIYIVAVGAFGLLGYWVGGLIIKDSLQIAHQFPVLMQKILGAVSDGISRLTGETIDVNGTAKIVTADIGSLFSGPEGLKLASYSMAAIFSVIMTLVLLIYLLISGRRLAAGAFWLVPPEYRAETDRLLRKVLPMLWRYFLGLVVIISYTTAVAWIAFTFVFHVPHAPVLSIAVGLMELIPVIGPAISFILIGLTAFQQTSFLGMTGLGALAVALRLSIDQIVGPLVLGRASQLHPVVIIFAFLSGAALFGIIGLLLAVPFAASVKIAVMMYYSEPVKD